MSFSSDQPLQANQLPISIDYPDPSEKEFVETLTTDRKRISDSMNSKEGALYDLNEQANFRKFYDPNNTQQTRNSYRSVFDLVMSTGGNIPPGVLAPQAHNTSNIVNSDLIYASCTAATGTTKFFTVMYPYIWLDDTNIYFTNPLGVNLSQVMVVANYLKN